MMTEQTTQGHGPEVQRTHQSNSWWLCSTIGFALLALCDALIAAEYKLIKGGQFELCRALEQNLNFFKEDPPMVCERKFHPGFKDFRVPNWEPLDPKANLDLLEQIYKAQFIRPLAVPEGLARRFGDEKWLRFKPELEKKISEGRVYLSKSRFDLAHNGEQVAVLKLVDDGCDPVKHFRFVNQPDPTLYVYNAKTRKLDRRYRDIINFTADAFFYQGRIRLATWSGLPRLEPPKLHIYETVWTLDEFGIALHPVCTYQ